MYGYSTAGGQRFPKALATHLNEYFHPYKPLTGDDILATGTATALHEILAFSFGDPGDGILVSRPCYGRFELDFGNKAEMPVVWADSNAENSFKPEVVTYLEEKLLQSNAAGTKIKALLIVNPHNPLGISFQHLGEIASTNIRKAGVIQEKLLLLLWRFARSTAYTSSATRFMLLLYLTQESPILTPLHL